MASNTSLRSASPPRIRSLVNRWKLAVSSVVLNSSSAADGVVPVAISLKASQVALLTKETSNSKYMSLQQILQIRGCQLNRKPCLAGK